MIETKIPMDVRSYKSKLIGPFTTRQLICVTIAVAFDAFLYFAVFRNIHISSKMIIFILAFIDVPILAFIFEPKGMPMEKYLKDVLFYNLLAPTKRKAKSSLTIKQNKTVYTKKELKQSKKRMKQAIKEHPEYKAYK